MGLCGLLLLWHDASSTAPHKIKKSGLASRLYLLLILSRLSRAIHDFPLYFFREPLHLPDIFRAENLQRS